MTLLLPLPSLLRTHNGETSECRSFATDHSSLKYLLPLPTWNRRERRGCSSLPFDCWDWYFQSGTYTVCHTLQCLILATSASLKICDECFGDIYLLPNCYYMNPMILTTLVSLLMCRAVQILVLSTIHLPFPSLLRTRDGETSEYLMCT